MSGLAPRGWQFFRDRPMDGAVVLFTMILFGFVNHGSYQSGWATFLGVLAGLAAALAGSDAARFRALMLACLMIALMVWVNYYRSANHGFMILWIGLALLMAAACPPGGQEPALRRNAAILLGLLMGIALIQKLRSPYYMQGDLLGGLLLEGEIYRNLLTLILPDWPMKLLEYRVAAHNLMVSPDPAVAGVAVPALVLWLARWMTVGSLVAQGVIEVALLFRRRLGWLFHALLLGFVAVVYSTRDENVFLSMNCLLGYCLTDDRCRGFRPVYALAVLYLLLAGAMGLRPWIIS